MSGEFRPDAATLRWAADELRHWASTERSAELLEAEADRLDAEPPADDQSLDEFKAWMASVAGAGYVEPPTADREPTPTPTPVTDAEVDIAGKAGFDKAAEIGGVSWLVNHDSMRAALEEFLAARDVREGRT